MHLLQYYVDVIMFTYTSFWPYCETLSNKDYIFFIFIVRITHSVVGT